MFSDVLESNTQSGRAYSNALGNVSMSSCPFISVDIFAIRNVNMASRSWNLDGFCFLNVKVTSEKGIFYVKYETCTRRQSVALHVLCVVCFSHDNLFSLYSLTL